MAWLLHYFQQIKAESLLVFSMELKWFLPKQLPKKTFSPIIQKAVDNNFSQEKTEHLTCVRSSYSVKFFTAHSTPVWCTPPYITHPTPAWHTPPHPAWHMPLHLCIAHPSPSLHDPPHSTPPHHDFPHPCMTYLTLPLHDPLHPTAGWPTPTSPTPPHHDPPHPYMMHPTPLLHDPPPTPAWPTLPTPSLHDPLYSTPPPGHFWEEHPRNSWGPSLCLPFGGQKWQTFPGFLVYCTVPHLDVCYRMSRERADFRVAFNPWRSLNCSL